MRFGDLVKLDTVLDCGITFFAVRSSDDTSIVNFVVVGFSNVCEVNFSFFDIMPKATINFDFAIYLV